MSRKRKKDDKGSLNHQMNKRMQSLSCIGESRHIAKEEYKQLVGTENTHNKSLGIHSHKTYDAYKSVSKQFVTYLRTNHPEIKDISEIDEVHIKNYVEHRAQEGYSPSTYSLDLAALNKLFNTELTKIDCNVSNRSFKTITNNRELKEHHNQINLENYKNEIKMIEGTGMRRSSLTKITKEDFCFENGVPSSVMLIEKGGKRRIAEIRADYRETIKDILDNSKEDKIFNHIPNRLPCHRYRQDYAKGLYQEKLDAVVDLKNREIFRGFDKEILKEVSENLGHKREDIIVYHYLI